MSNGKSRFKFRMGVVAQLASEAGDNYNGS